MRGSRIREIDRYFAICRRAHLAPSAFCIFPLLLDTRVLLPARHQPHSSYWDLSHGEFSPWWKRHWCGEARAHTSSDFL